MEVMHAPAKVFVILGEHYSTMSGRFEPPIYSGPWSFLPAGDDLAPAHALVATSLDPGGGVRPVLTGMGADLPCADIFAVTGSGAGQLRLLNEGGKLACCPLLVDSIQKLGAERRGAKKEDEEPFHHKPIQPEKISVPDELKLLHAIGDKEVL